MSDDPNILAMMRLLKNRMEDDGDKSVMQICIEGVETMEREYKALQARAYGYPQIKKKGS